MKPSKIFETPEASGFDRVTGDTERTGNNLIEHNGNYYVRCEAHEEVIRRLKEKHEEALTSQKEQMKRVVEGMQEYNMFPGSDKVYVRKDDIITKLNEI